MDNERPIEKLLRNYAKKRLADAGEPRKLHPATRQLLQGEVSRQFPKPRRRGSFLVEFFARWRPGLVYSLCVLAVVAISVPLLLPTFRKGEPESQQARATVTEGLADKKFPAAAPISATKAQEADETFAVGGAGRSNEAGKLAVAFTEVERAKDNAGGLRLEEEKQKSDRARTFATDAPARSAPATLPAVPQIASRDRATLDAQNKLERFTQETRVDDARGLALETRRTVAEAPAALAGEKTGARRVGQSPAPTDSLAGKTETLAARAPAVAPAPAAAAPALSDSPESAALTARYGLAKSAAVSVVQRFTQTQATGDLRRSADAGARVAPVLATFQLEQTGDQLRIIDNDGSSYTGAITSPVAGRPLGAIVELKGATALTVAEKSAVQSLSSPAPSNYFAGENFFFRVAGTNLTVQQPVVFTGQISILTNAPPIGQTAGAQTPAVRSQNQPLPAQNQLPSLLNSTISGNVQLGTNRERPVYAVPLDR